MPLERLPDFSADMKPEEQTDQLIKLNRGLTYLFNHLDHANVKRLYTEYCDIRSKAGETVIDGPTLEMKAAGSTTIRLRMGWRPASTAFVFQLYNSTGVQTVGIDSSGDGTFTGTITGGIIRTASSGNARIEMSGGDFKGLTAAGALSGFVIHPSSVFNTYVDAFLYHDSTKLVEFYDNAVSFTIRGTTFASSLGLGSTSCQTNAYGSWNFMDNVGFFGSTAVAKTAVTNLSTAATLGGTIDKLNELLNGLRTYNLV